MGNVVVEGQGELADALRAAIIDADCPTTVVVPHIETTAGAFAAIADIDFDAAWEQPMRAVITAFQRAHTEHRERVVALVPTIAMSGAIGLAASAATAEAVRALVKSAARQWGADGMTVNTIAVSPRLFGIDAAAVGTVSLAPPALAATNLVDDIVPIITMLASRDAHHVTGTTITADGGVWMAP